jgi:hypothetical protein
MFEIFCSDIGIIGKAAVDMALYEDDELGQG